MPAARAPLQRAALAKLGVDLSLFGSAAAAPVGRGRTLEAEGLAAVALAADAGVRVMCAGPPSGDSEALLGRALLQTAEPARIRLVAETAPLAIGLSLVETAARASLMKMQALRAAAIVAPASDLLGAEGPALWTRLQRLKAEGLYAAVGVSACATDDPAGLARRFKPDLMQLPVSLLDQRLIADGTLAALAEMGVEVHLRSVFQQGLLFRPRDGLPATLSGAGPRLSRIRRTIMEAGADPMQAALAFALNRPEASAVIVDVSASAELRAVLAAAVAPPPSLDWDTLRLDDPAALSPQVWAAA